MNRITLLLLPFFIVLNACKSANGHKGSNLDTVKTQAPAVAASIKQVPKIRKFSDTIKIDYTTARELLGVLPLLPDRTMSSWGWSKKEREDLVASASANNYFVDTTEHYNNIKKVLPHYFETQVVDGLWAYAMYKVSPDNYIIITDDMVGDGNDIQAFELTNHSLKDLKFESLVGDFKKLLLKDPSDETCKNSLDDQEPMFSYSFEVKNKLTINCYTLKKEDDEKCLKGNTLVFEFNSTTKKFDLTSVTWEEGE